MLTSAEWLSCADSLALTHGGKGFDLKLKAGALPPGAHYAEVSGRDALAEPSLGPLFSVPVTVVRPHADLRAAGAACFYSEDGMRFTPGHIERRFIVPPLGATWATLTLEVRGEAHSRELAGPCFFWLATSQLLPQTSMTTTSATNRVQMGLPADASAPPATYVKSIAVAGGVTLEVALAQWWMSLGDALASIRVEFYGACPSSEHVYLDGRAPFTQLGVLSPFRRMPIEPEGSLTHLVRPVRPHAAKLHSPAATAAIVGREDSSATPRCPQGQVY